MVATLSQATDPHRFVVSVLCLNHAGSIADELRSVCIPVLQVPRRRPGPDYFAFLKVAHILRKRRVHVVHTHNTQALIDGALGATLARVPALVHTDHGREFPDKVRYMFAERMLSRLAYRFVAVSEQTARDLVVHERISPKKVITIPNGVEGSRFDITFDHGAKRRELGLPGNGLLVGTVGRLSEEKGLEHLLVAMAAVVRALPTAMLVLVGSGLLETELREKAAALGIDNHVCFLGERSDIPEVMPLFDVYVISSVREGLPMALLEALAASRAVVATRVGGIPNVIDHEETGILVPPASPDDLARGILRLLSSDELRHRHGVQGHKVFEERFHARVMAQRYEQLYLRARQ